MKDTKIYKIVDGKKKIVWKNLFKTSVKDIFWIGIILFLAFSYKYDTVKCRDLLENPCSYITQFDCSNETYRQEDWFYQYYNITLNIPNATSKK